MYDISSIDDASPFTLFDSTSGLDSLLNQTGSFSDLLADRLKTSDAAQSKAQPTQTAGTSMDDLGKSIAKLVGYVEEAMNNIMKQLNLSLPDGFELRQTTAATRLKITGVSGHQDALENAVNSNGFLCQAFSSLQVQVTSIRCFTLTSTKADNGFSVAFKNGHATLDASGLTTGLADKLMEELDKARDENAENPVTEDTVKNLV